MLLTSGLPITLLLINVYCIVGTSAQFRFSKYYQNHMVIQRGAKSVVWGQSSHVGDHVHVYIDGNLAAHTTVNSNNVWQVTFTPPSGNGPHVISATSSFGTVSLHDVLFGDVWVCSGQSNMEFAVFGLLNATLEYQDTVHYPNIRLFHVDHAVSDTPLQELTKIKQNWIIPSEDSIKPFSAVCWLYGKYLSEHLNIPIGLVETNWGGTPVESWSSSDALGRCHTSHGKRNQYTHSSLYNAMISPLLRNTIYGAIWYQGESNAAKASDYECQFPAMINDWRQKFHTASKMTTSSSFPFGFVQLAPWRQGDTLRAFADLRWSQTAGFGYVPNPKMPRTFMAVAIDLPDMTSPYGAIHPRYKHDIAHRLVLSSLAVAYNQTGFDYEGPFPTSYSLDQTKSRLTIEFDHGKTPIEIRAPTGFEVCCSTGNAICQEFDNNWKNVTMTSHSVSSVVLDVAGCHVGGVRYNWRESPCLLRACSVYSRDSNLPAPPFKHEANIH